MSADIEIEGVSKRFGDFHALDDISMSVESGSFVTILGPSGSGKSTTLRIVGGFERPDRGRVLLDGQDITELPPEIRDVNTTFQGYALFPHMSVMDNVAFGLRVKKVKPAEIRRRVEDSLELVQLPGYGNRNVSNLSGGEKQRVALARAIINKPRVLLLDEPLSALDLKLRRQMQIELKHLQRTIGVTFLYVTHDQGEALAMSDQVVVMNRARIEQIGTPEEVYRSPRTEFVADFLGESNILAGTVLAAEGNRLRVAVDHHKWLTTGNAGAQGPGNGDVKLSVRPESIVVGAASEACENRTTATIEDAIYLGNAWELIITVGDTRMKCWTAARDLSLQPLAGETIAVGWNAGDMVVLQ